MKKHTLQFASSMYTNVKNSWLKAVVKERHWSSIYRHCGLLTTYTSRSTYMNMSQVGEGRGGTLMSRPERIYNPITGMGFSAMFTF